MFSPADALDPCLDPGMTEWERGRERDEFARAALLYASSHSTLSSRFTHAKEEDDSDQVEVPRDQEVCCRYSLRGEFFLNSFELFTYLLNLFIWGPQILVVAHGLSSCGSWALLLCSMWDLSSLTRD